MPIISRQLTLILCSLLYSTHPVWAEDTVLVEFEGTGDTFPDYTAIDGWTFTNITSDTYIITQCIYTGAPYTGGKVGFSQALNVNFTGDVLSFVAGESHLGFVVPPGRTVTVYFDLANPGPVYINGSDQTGIPQGTAVDNEPFGRGVPIGGGPGAFYFRGADQFGTGYVEGYKFVEPTCALESNSDGSITVSFTGTLQFGEDLSSFEDMDPQPESPYTFFPDSKGFFRATNQ